MALMLALVWCLWYNILPFVLRLHGPLRRLLRAPIDAVKRTLLTSIEIMKFPFGTSAQGNFMGGQIRVNQLFEDLQTTASTDSPNDITTIQDTLMDAIEREGLFPTQIFVDAAEVALSESNVVYQTPETDVYLGMVGNRPAHFIWYRIPKTQPHPDRNESLTKAKNKNVAVSLRLKHASIVPIEGIYRMNGDIDRTFLIRPAYDTLVQYLFARSDADCRSLLENIAEGLAYLHGLGIVHGGLTDQVILVNDSGVACLSDFSQAHTEGAQFTPTAYTQSMASSMKNIVWHAPELLEGLKGDTLVAPSKATDIYALGCLGYKMFTGKYPFRELMNCPQPMAIYKIMRAVLSGRRPAKPHLGDDAFVEHGLTEGIWTMIEACWSCDPHSRPSARLVGIVLTTDSDGQSEGE